MTVRRPECIETLRDGSRVLLRPICTGDVARNAEFISSLSAASRHNLFLGGITELGETALRRLCDPDHAHDMAYVAMAVGDGEERQVGVCRYASGDDPANGAEISVAVADAWQRKGLGTLLLRRLIRHARERGIPRLYSMDSATNQSMRALARRLGFAVEPDPDDVHQVICSLRLDEPAPTAQP